MVADKRSGSMLWLSILLDGERGRVTTECGIGTINESRASRLYIVSGRGQIGSKLRESMHMQYCLYLPPLLQNPFSTNMAGSETSDDAPHAPNPYNRSSRFI